MQRVVQIGYNTEDGLGTGKFWDYRNIAGSAAMKRKMRGGKDRELASIDAILNALDGLDGESIQRVLDYVIGRLSIVRPGLASGSLSLVGNAPAVQMSAPSSSAGGRQPSIKDLKDQKAPKSANQMAAVLAYYLSEVAPESERKTEIVTADLEKYFKQARFKLPKSLPHALPNAAAAGYLDALGNGQYRLNAVGYNLVVHSLPRGSDNSGKSGGTKK
jgi:hypothetical protein